MVTEAFQRRNADGEEEDKEEPNPKKARVSVDQNIKSS
jgi:hypothetical protein